MNIRSDTQLFVSGLYAYAEDKYKHSFSRGVFHIIERHGIFGFLQDSLPSWVSPICSRLDAKHPRDILVTNVLGEVDRALVCERCLGELQDMLPRDNYASHEASA